MTTAMVQAGDHAVHEVVARPEPDRIRSVAQLNMLHSLATTLNSLDDVHSIANAITAELRTIIDYHSCRVYLLQPDGSTLLPVSFRGEIFSDYENDTVETLTTKVGEGITGRVAEDRTSLLTPDARLVDFAVQIPGTDDILESMLAVPMLAGDQLIGVVVLSMLGYAKFDDEDQRLLEVLASHAAVAIGNARRLSELERFQELVESLDAVFWEAEPQTLRLSFVSSGAEHLLGGGSGPEGADDPRWGDHILPEDRAEALDRIRHAIGSGQDRQLEYRVSSRTGLVWIRDLVHVIGRGEQIRGLMVDITGRKRAEEALRRSERKFSEAFRREREAAQRLRTLDDMKNTFLEAVSHDLRTPLTSILGSALTLEQAGDDLSRRDVTDLVGRIAANARKLERLLGDLLDLDRLQRGIVTPQRRPTDLHGLIERSIEGAENPDARPIEVEAERVTVSVDAAKVERIVENLVSNALKHTGPQARIWVRAIGRDGGLDLVVEDDGAGIPPELHEAIFEPFRQAPGSSTAAHSPGVGIGLSLVRRFAELHGGRAWVEDRPDGGSSFHVFLPGG